MNTTDYIKMSLEMSNNWIMGLATDAADIAMTMPTPNGGNHPLWCVGHLAYSQANLLSMATGEPNALAQWEGISSSEQPCPQTRVSTRRSMKS